MSMECAAFGNAEPDAKVALASPEASAEDPDTRRWTETELEFCTRRALEEHRLATEAPTAAVAAAHLYLAASYSAKMAHELSRQAELEKLALSIS